MGVDDAHRAGLTVHHRVAAHPLGRRQRLVGIRIHLGQDEATVCFAGQLLEHRRKCFARPAPFGPEVHQHRHPVRKSQYAVLKTGCIHVENWREGCGDCGHDTYSW